MAADQNVLFFGNSTEEINVIERTLPEFLAMPPEELIKIRVAALIDPNRTSPPPESLLLVYNEAVQVTLPNTIYRRDYSQLTSVMLSTSYPPDQRDGILMGLLWELVRTQTVVPSIQFRRR